MKTNVVIGQRAYKKRQQKKTSRLTALQTTLNTTLGGWLPPKRRETYVQIARQLSLGNSKVTAKATLANKTIAKVPLAKITSSPLLL